MKLVSFERVLCYFVTSLHAWQAGVTAMLPVSGAYLYKPRIIEVFYNVRGSGVIGEAKNFT